jgi:hypothetical protein
MSPGIPDSEGQPLRGDLDIVSDSLDSGIGSDAVVDPAVVREIADPVVSADDAADEIQFDQGDDDDGDLIGLRRVRR